MKKHFLRTLFIAIVTAMFTTSCGKDNGTPDNNGDQDPTPKGKTIIELLSTSKAAYETAENGTWVPITNAEYDKLATELENITRSGTVGEGLFKNTGEYYEQGTSPVIVDVTTAQNSGNTLPKDSYLFAVRMVTAHGEGWSLGFKVKLSSTSVSSGYADVGTNFGTQSGERFFLLKGPFPKTTATGYIALMRPAGSVFVHKVTGDARGSYYIKTGDVNTGLTVGHDSRAYLFQGLSTTKVQW